MSGPKKKGMSKASSLQSLSSGDDAFFTPPSKTPTSIGLTGTTPSLQGTPKSVKFSSPAPAPSTSPSPSGSVSSVSSSISRMPIPPPSPSLACVIATTPSTPANKKSTKSKLSFRGSKNKQKSSSTAPSAKPSKSKAPLKVTKSKLPVNYTILISGTETESEASSVEGNTVALFKIKALSEKAYNIFRAVESGSLSGFKEAWKENPGFDINTKNPVGYTILHIAIRRQHEDLVKEIIDLGVEDLYPSVLYDVLLHSIQEQSMDLVTKIYEVMETRNLTDKLRQNRRKTTTSQSATSVNPLSKVQKSYRTIRMSMDEKETYANSEFDPDMTPLLLAAKVNSYELVEFFCSKGHTIPDFHERNCKCVDCGGPLREGIRRLMYYDAVSKPAYLCYLANRSDNYDLMLEIFKLIDKLREVGNIHDVEFKAEYKEIRGELKEFSCSILHQCRNSGEVELLFNQNEEKSGINKPLPRLQLAMRNRLKNIVAHPHSQQILYEHWAGNDWPEYRGFGPSKFLAHLIFRFFTWPIIAVWLIFDSRSKWGRLLSCPASRFLNWLASYLWFLLFLVIISSDAESTNSLGPPDTHLEFPLLLWIFGFIFSWARMLFKSAPYVTWMYFDVITYIMFLCAAAAAWCGYEEYLKHGGKARQYWSGTEATLVFEAFFACATICAFLKLFRILQLHLTLGPLITAIGRMSHDIGRMGAFFAITLLSFGLAFKRIYRPYQNWEEWKDDGSNKDSPETQESDLTTLHSSVSLLFWSLFGLGSYSATKIVGSTIPDPHPDQPGNMYMTIHAFIPQLTGKVLLIFYTIVGVNIMLNLLLGLMSKTYDLVYMERRDEEWKFARSTIWLSFMFETVNPPPFNLIPTIPCITALFGMEFCTPKNQNPSRTKLKQDDYSKLIRTLIQRYFRDKNDINNTEDAKQETVDALEEDMAELRALLDEIQHKTNAGQQGSATPTSAQKPTSVRFVSSQQSTPQNVNVVQENPLKSSASSPANAAFSSSSQPTNIPMPPPPPANVPIPPPQPGSFPPTTGKPPVLQSSVPPPPPPPTSMPSKLSALPPPPPPPPSMPSKLSAPPPPPPLPTVPTAQLKPQQMKTGPSKPKSGPAALGPPSLDTIKALKAGLRPTKSRVEMPKPVVPPLPPSRTPSQQALASTAPPTTKKVSFSK